MKIQFHIVPFTNPAGSIVWRVTGRMNGKRYRENFSSPDEALVRKQNLEREAANLVPLPSVTTRLTSDQAAEAESCFRRIIGQPFTMTQAIDYTLRNWKASHRTATVAAAYTEFAAAKKTANKREATLKSLKTRLSRLVSGCGAELLNTLTPETIRPFIYAHGSLVNQESQYRAHTNFFNWCKRQNYLAVSPMEQLPHIDLDDVEPIIIELDAARNLMTHALAFKDGRLVPYCTLALFCGVRPKEISKLTWANINVVTGTIIIPATVAKMRGRRVVTIPDNALEFLTSHAAEKTPLVGPNHRKNWDALRTLAGLKKDWTPDALRHTAISCHLAQHADENKTAQWAGNSPDVCHRHYKALVEPKVAAAFWAITPASLEPKPATV